MWKPTGKAHPHTQSRKRLMFGKRWYSRWKQLGPWIMWLHHILNRPLPADSLSQSVAFSCGWKALRPASRAEVSGCFVSRLKSWGPEPHKLPSLCWRIGGRVQPIVSIHFVIKESRGSANRAERPVDRALKHCIVEVSGPVCLSREGRRGEMSFCKLILLLRFSHSVTHQTLLLC